MTTQATEALDQIETLDNWEAMTHLDNIEGVECDDLYSEDDCTWTFPDNSQVYLDCNGNWEEK